MGEERIPESQWEWYGLAAHFIMGHACRFHMATKIGGVLISTLGQLWHDETVREIKAETRGVRLVGRGDARDADYMKKIGFDDIGYDRKFETMVFRVKGTCPCGCGQPEFESYSELDGDGYNEVEEARLGHMAMCSKWATDQAKLLEVR